MDGGQSHTEAVIADEYGNILGRGFGGASNHAEYPGGRARLRKAVAESVGEALRDKPETKTADRQFNAEEQINPGGISDFQFVSAHFGMTGGANYKEEIIGEIVRADRLCVGHDAPTALAGATGGKPGIVVIAGTGSVVYGENSAGETAQVGGLGYLFSDEGSGFWLALQTIRLAIKEQDELIEPDDLEKLVLSFFNRREIRELTDDFYNGKMTRDELASFAKTAHEAAAAGNRAIREQIKYGAAVLIESVRAAARRLEFAGEFAVAGAGGMFRAPLMVRYFREMLSEEVPGAIYTEPRFNPAEGALMLAFRQFGIEITENLLFNLEKGARRAKANLK